MVRAATAIATGRCERQASKVARQERLAAETAAGLEAAGLELGVLRLACVDLCLATDLAMTVLMVGQPHPVLDELYEYPLVHAAATVWLSLPPPPSTLIVNDSLSLIRPINHHHYHQHASTGFG